jgi:tyrosyl-tRNA synthetase
LLTDLPEERIGPGFEPGGSGNPLQAKFALARRVVADYHGDAAAEAARAEYDRVHQQGGLPDVVPEWRPDASVRRTASGGIQLPTAIAASGLASSSSEARRLIQGNGVRIDGAVVNDVKLEVGPGTYVVQVGKTKAARWILVQ